MGDPDARRLVSRPHAVRLLVFASFAFLLIAAQGLSMTVHGDTARDFRYAKNCRIGSAGCQSHGTSVEGLFQGRLFLYAINWLQDIDLHGRLHLTVFCVLTAIGIAVVAEAAMRSFEARGSEPQRARACALGVVACLAFVVPWMADHPVFWNPTLGSLPLCLWTASLVALTSERAELACAAIAVSAVLAYHGHIIYLVIWFAALPAVAALVKGWRGPLGVLLGVPLGLWVIDATSLEENRAFVEGLPGGLWPFVATPFVLFGLGRALRGPVERARQRLGPDAGWVTAGSCGLACAVALALVLRVLDRPFDARYIAPALPALALVVSAWVSHWCWRIHRLAPAGLAIVGIVIATRFPDDRLTVAELHRVDTQLGDSGPLSTNLYRVRGIRAGAMTEMMRALDRDAGPPLPPDGTVLQLTQAETSTCPEALGWGCGTPRDGGILVWKEDPSPWFSPIGFEMAAGDTGPIEFQPLVTDPSDPFIGPDAFGGTNRLVERIVFEAHDGPRNVLLEPGWRLVEATGGRATPGARFGDSQWVVVEARDGARGSLIIERLDPPVAMPRRPAVSLELTDEEFVALFPRDARDTAHLIETVD